MKVYQPKTPRAAISLATLAMTALTMTVLVAAPAQLGSDRQYSKAQQRETMLVAVTPKTKTAEPLRAIAVTIIPARIDVVASRDAIMAAEMPPKLSAELQTSAGAVATSVQVPNIPPKRKQQT